MAEVLLTCITFSAILAVLYGFAWFVGIMVMIVMEYFQGK